MNQLIMTFTKNDMIYTISKFSEISRLIMTKTATKEIAIIVLIRYSKERYLYEQPIVCFDFSLVINLYNDFSVAGKSPRRSA